MKPIRMLLPLVWLTLVGTAAAHTPLARSDPADGSTGPAPTIFTLTFGHEARLTSLTLRAVEGEARPVPGVDRQLATEHRVSAPPLTPGRYALDWRAAAPDGHVMRGTIRFTVATAPSPRAPGAPRATH